MSLPPQHSLLNLLEPPEYLRLFQEHPPVGFACAFDSLGQSFFVSTFNLLTTLERKTLRFLRQLPLFRVWSRLFKIKTCFVGATSTEYAPLAAGIHAGPLLRKIMAEHGQEQALLVLKDLPEASPLLSTQANELSYDLAAEAARHGLIEVQGQALAYLPLDFSSTEEYLGRLSPTRRKDLRRKLKKRELLDVQILELGNRSFFEADLLEALYAMYLSVYEQSEIHFDLLSREYFSALLQAENLDGIVVIYRRKGEEGLAGLVGYNISLRHDGRLIDKYIGLKYPEARELNLYFISWLVNLEYALANGLNCYVAGWTDPEVKKSLGAHFTFTRHLVWVKNPLLRRILYPLRHLFEADRRAMKNTP